VAIGYEKAGVMRPGIPVICGDRNPPDSIPDYAHKVKSELFMLGRDFDYKTANNRLELRIDNHILEMPLPAMPGAHQMENLACAVSAFWCLLGESMMSKDGWKEGIDKARVPGRLSRSANDARFVLDVGHNPAAAEVVARYLESNRSGRVFCVLGMLRDKDAVEVVRKLSDSVDYWLCAGIPGSRGQSGKELEEKMGESPGASPVTVHVGVPEAVAEAAVLANDEDLILVFGSFQTVSLAMKTLARDGRSDL
jgi:dihydrofolate synthase/folylpolyglutamate synthase